MILYIGLLILWIAAITCVIWTAWESGREDLW